ncbi:MAG TPA: YbjN domain-containing protein [Polyangia bacterium]
MSYRDLINGYVQRFSTMIGVEMKPLDDEGFTAIKRGSATVGINLLDDHGLLVFLAPIMQAPERNQAEFYRRLLELNFLTTSDGAFAIDRKTGLVHLRALRGLEGLDFEEFTDMLDTVGAVADEWDDKLKAEFGGP